MKASDLIRHFVSRSVILLCALDCSLAEQLFGFHAKTSLSVGLRRTIEWYRIERERNALFPGKEDSSPTTAVS